VAQPDTRHIIIIIIIIIIIRTLSMLAYVLSVYIKTRDAEEKSVFS
jgi:flagellar basal body-associated protein FliL